MKRFPKTLVTLLVLVLFISLFPSVSFAAGENLKEVRLTGAQLQVGHYTNTSLTGSFVLNSANSDIAKETKNLVDNKSNPFFWSIPYEFNDLVAYGGNIVPAILIDVANGGEPANICGFNMQLREYLDCHVYSFEIQATTSADSNDYIKVFADDNTSWDGADYHCEFPEVTAYKVRVLIYDIGEADTAADAGHYTTLTGSQTRFSLAEIDLLTKREAATNPTETPTEAPTQTPSRPGILIPTTPPTQTPTAAPTLAPTAAPTQAPTATPTAAPTQAPTTPVTEPTLETTPVTEPTLETTPTDIEPPIATAPSEDTPTAPTEEVSTDPIPTEAAPTEPMDTATTPATDSSTEPDATTPTTDGDEEDEPDNTVLIVVVVAIVAVAAGLAAYFVIKKKRG